MISDMAPSSNEEYSILDPSCRSYIRHHMIITQKNECAMCEKDATDRGFDNYNKENEQEVVGAWIAIVSQRTLGNIR
jgi:hypothetical protein